MDTTDSLSNTEPDGKNDEGVGPIFGTSSVRDLECLWLDSVGSIPQLLAYNGGSLEFAELLHTHWNQCKQAIAPRRIHLMIPYTVYITRHPEKAFLCSASTQPVQTGVNIAP